VEKETKIALSLG